MTKTTSTALAALVAFGFGSAGLAQDRHGDMDHSKMDHAQMDHAQHEDGHQHGDDHGHDHADADADAPLPDGLDRTITVRVNGMVCDFCARSLTKVLRRDDNVEAVAISLEDKTVTIVLTEDGEMDDAAVEKAVKNAGYNVASIERGAA